MQNIAPFKIVINIDKNEWQQTYTKSDADACPHTEQQKIEHFQKLLGIEALHFLMPNRVVKDESNDDNALSTKKTAA